MSIRDHPPIITHIFWPVEDVKYKGLFYGWQRGSYLVVSGVLPGGSAEEINQRLLQLASSTSVDSVDRTLSVLGECTPSLDKIPSPPSLQINNGVLSAAPTPTFILYRRLSMGYASFHLSSAPTARTQPPLALVGADRTSKTLSTQAPLDASTLAELNATFRIHRTLTATLRTGGPQAALDKLKHICFDTLRSGFFSWFKPGPFIGVSHLLEQILDRWTLITEMTFRIVPQSNANTEGVDNWASHHKFGNALWLILNDLALGIIIGNFIAEHRSVLGTALGSIFMTVFVDFVRDCLIWLDSWPAGLKLNTEFSHFLCKLLLYVTDVWADTIRHMLPHFPHLVAVAGYMGFGGLTLTIALSLDVLYVLTLPATLSYHLLFSVLRFQFSTLSSLWNLFRGKRYNVLRQHVDSYDYDIDQLLLGTLLFTLLTFSLPTFVAYAALFIMMNTLVLSATASVKLLLKAMNSFPLFAILLRVKDPRRLPGLIYLRPATHMEKTLFLEVEHASLVSLLPGFRTHKF